MRTDTSLSAILSVWCGLAAWLVCEFQRVFRGPRDVMVAAIAVAGGALCGALIGHLLERGLERHQGLRRFAALFWVIPCGIAVSIAAGSVISGTSLVRVVQSESPLVGLVASLVALPPLALMLRGALAARGMRSASLLFEMRRRALTTLPATSIAVGCLVAAVGNPETGYYGMREFSGVGLPIAILATVSIASVLSYQASLMRFAREVHVQAAQLSAAQAADTDWRNTELVDLGSGDDLHVFARLGRTAYRQGGDAGLVELVVRGEPMLAHHEAQRLMRKTTACFAIAAAATIACGVTLGLGQF